jgi:hypothetical protein
VVIRETFDLRECAQCDEPGRPLAMHRGEICARRKDACVRPQLFFHLEQFLFKIIKN